MGAFSIQQSAVSQVITQKEWYRLYETRMKSYLILLLTADNCEQTAIHRGL